MRNNKYKVHRILMPDGSMFKFEDKKTDTEREMQRGVPKRSLADATSSVSKHSIEDSNSKVNRNAKMSSKDRLASPKKDLRGGRGSYSNPFLFSNRRTWRSCATTEHNTPKPR